jgi:hypothetical protein
MKALSLAFVLLGSFAAVGCDEEQGPGQSSRRQPAPVAEVKGRWEMDVSAFVTENWAMLAQGARKAVEPLRQERERIAALRVGERVAAERELQQRIDALPSDKRAAVMAGLGSSEDLKEWVRTTVATRMSASSLSLEFHAGGRCTFAMAIPGKEKEDAEGTWSQKGDKVMVKMTQSNGKPAKGKDLEPVTMVVKGDRLQFTPVVGGPKIVARRV